MGREVFITYSAFFNLEKKMNIGIMGGTFNPIHNAHLAMACRFAEFCSLDNCFLVPAYISPFKINHDLDFLVSTQQRLEMINLAVKNYNNIQIDSFEIDRPEISYSINTINYFRSKFPNDRLFLLIGTDQAISFKKWKDYKFILNEAVICIVKRPDFNANKELDIINQTFDNYILIESPIINITSTKVREYIKAGKSIEKLVPAEILDYINKNKLYI